MYDVIRSGHLFFNVVFAKIDIFLEHTTHEPLLMPKSEDHLKPLEG